MLYPTSEIEHLLKIFWIQKINWLDCCSHKFLGLEFDGLNRIQTNSTNIKQMIILNPKAQISANFTISLTHSLRLGDAYMRR